MLPYLWKLSSKTQPMQISLQLELRLMTVDGEVQIPQQLTQFFTHLVVGPYHRSHELASKIRRVESLAADTVFLVTNERKKPSKHLKLGLAVKSMTGSKKLIGMLNNRGTWNRANAYCHIRFKDFTSWPGTRLFINSWYCIWPLRLVCGNPLWQKHLAQHSGYCVPNPYQKKHPELQPLH